MIKRKTKQDFSYLKNCLKESWKLGRLHSVAPSRRTGSLQYFLFRIFLYKLPICHRDPGTPVPLLMIRHKSDLLKFMVWPYLTIPMSAWPLYYILPRRQWRVIIHSIFRHLSLLPELTHRQNFVPVCCERIPPVVKRSLFVFSQMYLERMLLQLTFCSVHVQGDWIPQMSPIDNSYRKIRQLVYS